MEPGDIEQLRSAMEKRIGLPFVCRYSSFNWHTELPARNR